MALQCRYTTQGRSGQLCGRAEAVSRRAVEWAAPPSEEIRQPRVVELPVRLCVGLKLGRSIEPDFYRSYFLKYRVSGGAWSFLTGIKYPSALIAYISVPTATKLLLSMQLFSHQRGRGFGSCTYFLSTTQGRVRAWSRTVI